MRKSRIMMAGFAAVMAVAAPVAATGVAQAGTGSAHAITRTALPPGNGCPVGDACMYTLPGWHNGTPKHVWIMYGCSNLINKTGEGVLYNRTGAILRYYYEPGCTKLAGQLNPGQSRIVNFSLINSISIDP